MDILLLAKALLLGLVEGMTEFLPISSTGHLIVIGDLINFQNDGKVFEVVIQLGAILAIVWEYRARFLRVACGLGRDPLANRFVLNLFIAFLPAAIMGMLFIKPIKAHFFNAISVATALIVGGLIILWVERRDNHVRVRTVDEMRPLDALKVGLAQMLALIPGTSRSGSTIIGGIAFGLSRQAATEFSFFLAVPVMFAATFYDIYKHYELFSSANVAVIAVGFVAAFFSAFVAVRGLIRFVSGHNYVPFAWYRIAFGLFILLSWQFGWIDWAVQ